MSKAETLKINDTRVCFSFNTAAASKATQLQDEQTEVRRKSCKPQ